MNIPSQHSWIQAQPCISNSRLIYRSLATAGTTAALFAHESGKPVTLIDKATRSIETRGKRLLGEQYSQAFSSPVDILYRAANSLKSFAKFPVYLLKRAKRRSTAVEVHAVITDVIELFRPFLAEAKVEVQPLLTDETPIVRGSVALLEAILVNLMTNAINALMTKGTSTEQRQIRICTDVTDTQLELRFLDNGPGIQGLDLEEIWLPGRTNTRGGTGLA